MRRFQWKVVSLMVLVSAVPLLSSAVVVDQLLKDTVALGLDDHLGQSLDRSEDVYRRYITLRKQVLPLHAQSLAHDAELLEALGGADPDHKKLRQLLRRRAGAFDGPDQGISRLSLVPAGVAAPGPSEAPPPGVVLVDRAQRFPADTWRGRSHEIQLSSPSGPWTLTVTYVIPNSLLQDYRALGEVNRTFEHMESRQAALTQGYLKTFLATSLVILAATFALGLLLARRTTHRIGLLTEGTTLVARGDLEIQVPVQGEDEIAQLTENFNRMVVELRQARGRLAYLERMSAWQEIARRLAHEIKNPLTPILLAVQQLDRKFEDLHTRPERYRKLVSTAMEIVSEEVDALRRLVQEFSDFARLPSVQPAPTALRPYLEEILRTNLQFQSHLAEPQWQVEAPVEAAVDQLLMRRVLINLLQNACDAVREARAEPEGSVTLRLRTEGRGALIEVEDRGEGVPEANLGRLFDPYFTTKDDGTGLGLAIVKKIIIEHGGDIEVLSPPPGHSQGALFTVRLPLLEEAQEPAALTQQEEAS